MVFTTGLLKSLLNYSYFLAFVLSILPFIFPIVQEPFMPPALQDEAPFPSSLQFIIPPSEQLPLFIIPQLLLFPQQFIIPPSWHIPPLWQFIIMGQLPPIIPSPPLSIIIYSLSIILASPRWHIPIKPRVPSQSNTRSPIIITNQARNLYSPPKLSF